MKVYLAGPITEDVLERADWRDETKTILSLDNIVAVLPRPLSLYEDVYGISEDDAGAVLTVRDHKFSTKSDAVLANFEGSQKGSLGTAIELGWASEAGVTIVGVVPEGNVHEHPMILTCLTFRAYTLDEGIRIIQALAGERF